MSLLTGALGTSIDLARAMDPGLAYDIDEADYTTQATCATTWARRRCGPLPAQCSDCRGRCAPRATQLSKHRPSSACSCRNTS